MERKKNRDGWNLQPVKMLRRSLGTRNELEALSLGHDIASA
jgi:hypothetical protein